MPMGLEIYLISSLISNTFQFPKSFLEPTEKYEEPKISFCKCVILFVRRNVFIKADIC